MGQTVLICSQILLFLFTVNELTVFSSPIRQSGVTGDPTPLDGAITLIFSAIHPLMEHAIVFFISFIQRYSRPVHFYVAPSSR